MNAPSKPERRSLGADHPSPLNKKMAELKTLDQDLFNELLECNSGNETKQKAAREVLNLIFERGEITDYQTRVISRGKANLLLMQNYLILDKIGKGSMGMVFRAEHINMKRVVALKVLVSKQSQDRLRIERFLREIRAAGQLKHPNIVVAYDSNQAHGYWFLVSEFVEGNNLEEFVKENGPVGRDLAIDIILQVAEGLAFAHGVGVIHRDIKPSNLIRNPIGDVKILDLGLVRWQSEEDDVRLTKSGILTGTPAFMAPEQAESANRVDSRSDIYSLGCTLYFLLTGKLLYEEESILRMLMAHRDQPVPNLSDQVQGVDDELKSVFEMMVAKDPKARYQDAVDLVEDLKSLKNQSSPWHAGPATQQVSQDRFADFLQELDNFQFNDSSQEFYLDESEASIPTITIHGRSQLTHNQFPVFEADEHQSSVYEIRARSRARKWDWTTIALIGMSTVVIFLVGCLFAI